MDKSELKIYFKAVMDYYRLLDGIGGSTYAPVKKLTCAHRDELKLLTVDELYEMFGNLSSAYEGIYEGFSICSCKDENEKYIKDYLNRLRG